MAVTTKTNLKTYFNKGDKPTENQFGDLIDSFMHAETSEFVNITSSGVISSSKAGTGFGLIAHSASFQYLSASTGEFDANTIRIGGSSFSKTDVDEIKEIETKRKSDDGIPMKRIRGFTSASTFIDLEATNKTTGDRIDIKVADTFEALSISTARVSLGPKETVPLQLTGSITTLTTGQTSTPTGFDGAVNLPTGSYGIIIDNGLITSGTLTVDNALSIAPGTGLINGALGVMGGVGNSQTITQDTVVQPGYNIILWVNNYNDSLTINQGVDYTIGVGSDVTIKKP